jgi:hypothetical protein
VLCKALIFVGPANCPPRQSICSQGDRGHHDTSVSTALARGPTRRATTLGRITDVFFISYVAICRTRQSEKP